MKPRLGLATLLLLGAMAAACADGSPEATRVAPAAGEAGTPAVPASAPNQAAAASGGITFPTGPAVLVAADYQPPKGKVDSTGAFLPANGKPTVVWVDAIW